MNNIIIHGANKEDAKKYLLYLITQNLEPSYCNKLRNMKIVIILPNTLNSIKKKYENDESLFVEQLNQIHKDIHDSSLLINLDCSILQHSFYGTLSHFIEVVPVIAGLNQVNVKPDILKSNNNENRFSKTNQYYYFRNDFELNNTVIVGGYDELKYFNNSENNLIVFNNHFRFNINDLDLVINHIKKPVEILAIAKRINKKIIFNANFRKLDYKNFIDIFKLIKKIINNND